MNKYWIDITSNLSIDFTSVSPPVTNLAALITRKYRFPPVWNRIRSMSPWFLIFYPKSCGEHVSLGREIKKIHISLFDYFFCTVSLLWWIRTKQTTIFCWKTPVCEWDCVCLCLCWESFLPWLMSSGARPEHNPVKTEKWRQNGKTLRCVYVCVRQKNVTVMCVYKSTVTIPFSKNYLQNWNMYLSSFITGLSLVLYMYNNTYYSITKEKDSSLFFFMTFYYDPVAICGCVMCVVVVLCVTLILGAIAMPSWHPSRISCSHPLPSCCHSSTVETPTSYKKTNFKKAKSDIEKKVIAISVCGKEKTHPYHFDLTKAHFAWWVKKGKGRKGKIEQGA